MTLHEKIVEIFKSNSVDFDLFGNGKPNTMLPKMYWDRCATEIEQLLNEEKSKYHDVTDVYEEYEKHSHNDTQLLNVGEEEIAQIIFDTLRGSSYKSHWVKSKLSSKAILQYIEEKGQG